jgi:N-formylglutamate amidohydrolase
MPLLIDAFDPPFEVIGAAGQDLPAVFNSPHSGRTYPESFLRRSRLDALTLRRSEDCYVDELFLGVVDLGCPLLRANFPRAYLDLNREPYELDPEMFGDRLPEFANTSSMRVAGGLGTIPRIVSEREEIYDRPLSFEEAEARIERLYRPYHRTLAQLVASTMETFGGCVLIDCHSMPSTAAPQSASGARARADVVLGDRFGASAAPAITGALETAFGAAGMSVVRNKPYAGGFITQTHGRPREGLHSVQVEINRALYLDERLLRPNANFAGLKSAISAAAALFLRELPDLIAPRRIAAE